MPRKDAVTLAAARDASGGAASSIAPPEIEQATALARLAALQSLLWKEDAVKARERATTVRLESATRETEKTVVPTYEEPSASAKMISKLSEAIGGGVVQYNDDKRAGLCAVCGKDSAAKCGRCHSVSYCGRACQKQDWKAGHKDLCPILVRLERERKGKDALKTCRDSAPLGAPDTRRMPILDTS